MFRVSLPNKKKTAKHLKEKNQRKESNRLTGISKVTNCKHTTYDISDMLLLLPSYKFDLEEFVDLELMIYASETSDRQVEKKLEKKKFGKKKRVQEIS